MPANRNLLSLRKFSNYSAQGIVAAYHPGRSIEFPAQQYRPECTKFSSLVSRPGLPIFKTSICVHSLAFQASFSFRVPRSTTAALSFVLDYGSDLFETLTVDLRERCHNVGRNHASFIEVFEMHLIFQSEAR